MAIRCKACGGVYEPIQSDGTEYYHVCPPITLVAAQRDGKALYVPLPELRETDSVRVQRGDSRVTVTVAALEPGDRRLGDTTIERSDKRDERPVERFRNGQMVAEPTAVGAGVETVITAEPAPADIFTSDAPIA